MFNAAVTTKGSNIASVNERLQKLCRADEGRVNDGDMPIQQLTMTIPLLIHSLAFFFFFLQPNSLSQFNVFFLLSVSLLLQPPDFRLCLFIFFLIPLFTHSLSPGRSLGLGLWHCLSHQMVIGHSGKVWELENELLTDNSQPSTLSQTKEIEKEERGKWEREGIARHLFDTRL